MPDLHGWLTQQITEAERIARACTATDWRHIDEGVIVDRDTDGWQHAPDNARIASVACERIYYSCSPPHAPDADHIVTHDPAAVLRRCAADRKILDEHRPYGSGTWAPYACVGCGEYGEDWRVDHINDCPTLQALAEGYGLTAEQLAALDRPEPPPPEPHPAGRLTKAFWDALAPRTPTADVPASLRGPDWKDTRS